MSRQVARGPENGRQSASCLVVFVFQYLVGNTDWSFVADKDKDTCCHNGDLLDLYSRFHCVPYDFDLAGLVDARFAYPDSSLRIRKATQRLYRGLCLSPDKDCAALRNVTALHSDILQVMREVPGLSTEDIEANAVYLNQFFAKVEDEATLLETFARRCL